MPLIDGRILDLTPSRVDRDIQQLGPGVDQVQFNSALTDREYRLVADALREHPAVHLRAYAAADSITDLEFLRFFPDVPGFWCDLRSVTDLAGLRHLRPDLRWLGIGQTARRLSLRPLARFRALEVLRLDGHTKDLELEKLGGLVSLTLRSVTLPDLSSLMPLTNLRALHLKLGGTHDLRLLPKIGRLQRLEIWMVKGLTDLSPLADLTHLKRLHLESLRRIEALPPMERLAALRAVYIENLRGLDDLSPLASAPALRQLALVNMTHLQPADLAPLIGHPTLQRLRAGLGSIRRNEAAKALLGLPDIDWSRRDWA